MPRPRHPSSRRAFRWCRFRSRPTSGSASRSQRSGPTSRTRRIPGGWLAERLLDLPAFVTLHGVITLGDSALAAVVGLDPDFRPDAEGRVVTDIDMRLLWGDLLAKLRLHHRRAERR